ncbi:Alg9-like mannosyltransferase family-domain-containing protein [Thamnidium elegans]|nr:Alg9-like mannosyltransferase family-domain-containing protein [Thamnidium elegans]
MIRYLTFAGIVFRFEIGILLVILVLTEIYYGRLSFVASIKQMVVTAIISLIITVPLDSFFWNQWIWPEGIVFYFNVILNKSSQWGTLPFYAYFLKFLPRLLLISFPLSALAYVIDSRVKRMLTPMLIYVAVFSCLPHKEWRFIVYTLPVFTVAAAASVTWFINRACRSLFYRMVLVGVAVSYVISFMVSLSAFQISRHNYPGGEALFTLHQIEKDNQVRVHLDTETAMTGASLFGQTNPNWVYSKNETHHSQHDFIEGRYTHLITSRPEKFDTSLFEVIDQTYGIDKVELKSLEELIASIKQFDFSYLNVKLVPKLFTIKLIDPQKTWVQSTLRKYPVVLYSKTYCPYCKAAKQLISKYCDDIHVIEVDLEQDARDIQQALYDLTGQYTFPNLFQNQISLGGFDRLSELDRKGELNLCKK